MAFGALHLNEVLSIRAQESRPCIRSANTGYDLNEVLSIRAQESSAAFPNQSHAMHLNEVLSIRAQESHRSDIKGAE